MSFGDQNRRRLSETAAECLTALSDPISLAIIGSLMNSPKTQKQLRIELSINSSTASRRMAVLEGLRLVERSTGHGPYSLVLPTLTADVLAASAVLADSLDTARREHRRPVDQA